MKKLILSLFIAFTSLAAQAQPPKADAPPVFDAKVRIIKFYPNPAVSVISFEFQRPLDRGYTLQIFNFLGKKVFERNMLSQKNDVPLTEFYRGVYIFQLRDKSGKIIESGKFQVAK
jgi:hypothetical protein